MKQVATERSANLLYRAVWRWHFYAGLYVIPFIVMLALTGLVMLLRPQIEEYLYHDAIFVSTENATIPRDASGQLYAVKTAYKDGTIGEYIPPIAADRSSQFSVTTQDGAELTVFVNPYTAEVVGSVDVATTWYAIAENIHGSLLLGDFGDYLIEIAAGFGILLVVTGFFMWGFAPKQLNTSPRIGRARWRHFHATTGVIIGVPLLFFLLIGLSWTGVWGSKIVQPWNGIPSHKWEMESSLPTKTEASMNRLNLKGVPWTLEQAPLPTSNVPSDVSMPQVNINSVVEYAKTVGFTNYRVHLPTGPQGVWTISADTMSGDITNPLEDHTVHLDQYSGEELADIRFADYPLLGKAMAAGVALHQGGAGLGNLVFNIAFCLAIVFMAVSAVAMWWRRRPKGAARVAAPSTPNLPFWKSVTPVLICLSLFFPLTAGAFIGVLMLDTLVLSRVPKLQRFFN